MVEEMERARSMEVQYSSVMLADKGQWHKRCWPLPSPERLGGER